MRIAITGGSGKIGVYTVREFQEHGYEVRNLDAVRPSHENLPTTIVDVAHFGDLVSCLNGFDAIVHLGAIVAPGRTSNNTLFRTNTQGTFNVLEAASVLGIKKVCLAPPASMPWAWVSIWNSDSDTFRSMNGTLANRMRLMA